MPSWSSNVRIVNEINTHESETWHIQVVTWHITLPLKRATTTILCHVTTCKCHIPLSFVLISFTILTLLDQCGRCIVVTWHIKVFAFRLISFFEFEWIRFCFSSYFFLWIWMDLLVWANCHIIVCGFTYLWETSLCDTTRPWNLNKILMRTKPYIKSYKKSIDKNAVISRFQEPNCDSLVFRPL